MIPNIIIKLTNPILLDIARFLGISRKQNKQKFCYSAIVTIICNNYFEKVVLTDYL